MTELGSNYETEDLGNGQFQTTIHARPIAYSPNGALRHITNILGASGNPNMPVGLSELIQFQIRDKLAGQSPVLHFGRRQSGNFVKITPLDTNNVNGISIGTNGYKFAEAWNNADLELIIIGHRLQKNIYLRSGHPVSFRFRIDDHSGFNLETLATSDFRILQPALQNPATGEAVGLTWGKEQSGGKTILTATLPMGDYAGWILDPTIETIQPGAATGKDAEIVSTAPTNNRGAAVLVGAGESSASAAVVRGLLQFNLSTIPVNAVVSSVILSLWSTFERSTNARAMRVYRMIQAWVEGTGNNTATGDGATWNTYNGVNNWQTAGAAGANDAEATAIGSINMPAGTGAGAVAAVQRDITLTASKVQGWISGAFANNGMLLKMDTETDDLWDFDSSDGATAGQRPRLVITYTLSSTRDNFRGQWTHFCNFGY